MRKIYLNNFLRGIILLCSFMMADYGHSQFRLASTRVEIVTPADSSSIRYAQVFEFTLKIVNTGTDTLYPTDSVDYKWTHDWKPNDFEFEWKQAPLNILIAPGDSAFFFSKAFVNTQESRRGEEYVKFGVNAMFFGPNIDGNGTLIPERQEEQFDNYPTIVLRYDGYLGVADLGVDNQVSVYPNPSDGVFIFKGAEILKTVVYNTAGQQIYKVDAMKDNQIDLGVLKPGVYFLDLINHKSVTRSRVVIR